LAKDKKSKKKGKSSKSAGAGSVITERLRDLTQNPLVADIVAAALVGAAAALKDTRKAEQLANSAEKDLEKLARKSADRGNALWQMALDVGRKSIDALGAESAPKKRKAKKTAATPKAAAKPKAKTAAKPKAKAASRKR
jgi:hypothetical protein